MACTFGVRCAPVEVTAARTTDPHPGAATFVASVQQVAGRAAPWRRCLV
jgi:hypothetical protein